MTSLSSHAWEAWSKQQPCRAVAQQLWLAFTLLA